MGKGHKVVSGRLWNARLNQQMALVTFDIFVEVEPKKLTSSNDCATDGKENEVIQFYSLPAGATFHRKEPQNKIILFIFEKSSYLFHPQNQDDEAIVKSFF